MIPKKKVILPEGYSLIIAIIHPGYYKDNPDSFEVIKAVYEPGKLEYPDDFETGWKLLIDFCANTDRCYLMIFTADSMSYELAEYAEKKLDGTDKLGLSPQQYIIIKNAVSANGPPEKTIIVGCGEIGTGCVLSILLCTPGLHKLFGNPIENIYIEGDYTIPPLPKKKGKHREFFETIGRTSSESRIQEMYTTLEEVLKKIADNS